MIQRPSPAILMAFERWRAAETACHYAEPATDEEMNRLLREASAASRELALMPAQSGLDLAFKLLPLALIEHDPHLGDPPLKPRLYVPDGTDYQETTLWRGIIADLATVSPTIAHAMATPASEYSKTRAAAIAGRVEE